MAEPESVLVLAGEGAALATLVIVADGKRLTFPINQTRLLWLIESAAESLRRMNEKGEL
jgi:hypothetical protein